VKHSISDLGPDYNVPLYSVISKDARQITEPTVTFMNPTFAQLEKNYQYFMESEGPIRY